MKSLALHALPGLPEIAAGADFPALLFDALTPDFSLQPGDVLVLAQKIVSKAEGRTIRLATSNSSNRGQTLRLPRI